jgi:hypothetical protein
MWYQNYAPYGGNDRQGREGGVFEIAGIAVPPSDPEKRESRIHQAHGARAPSEPDRWQRSIERAIAVAMKQMVESLALYAASMYPQLLLLLDEPVAGVEAGDPMHGATLQASRPTGRIADARPGPGMCLHRRTGQHEIGALGADMRRARAERPLDLGFDLMRLNIDESPRDASDEMLERGAPAMASGKSSSSPPAHFFVLRRASSKVTPIFSSIAIRIVFWYSRCRRMTSTSCSALILISRSCSALASAWRPWMFWPTMIRGMSKICIRFEIKSQNTKAMGGSNCSFGGASRFQPSQTTVQAKISRKNPIVPTRSVIHTASFSSGPIVAAISSFTL